MSSRMEKFKTKKFKFMGDTKYMILKNVSGDSCSLAIGDEEKFIQGIEEVIVSQLKELSLEHPLIRKAILAVDSLPNFIPQPCDSQSLFPDECLLVFRLLKIHLYHGGSDGKDEEKINPVSFGEGKRHLITDLGILRLKEEIKDLYHLLRGWVFSNHQEDNADSKIIWHRPADSSDVTEDFTPFGEVEYGEDMQAGDPTEVGDDEIATSSVSSSTPSMSLEGHEVENITENPGEDMQADDPTEVGDDEIARSSGSSSSPSTSLEGHASEIVSPTTVLDSLGTSSSGSGEEV